MKRDEVLVRLSEGEEIRAMASDTADVQGELEQLRRRFEGFRNMQFVRSRLPESLWVAAAELARRRGVNPTARTLRLDYTGLKKRAVSSTVTRGRRQSRHTGGTDVAKSELKKTAPKNIWRAAIV
jgi:hypothetical protein